MQAFPRGIFYKGAKVIDETKYRQELCDVMRRLYNQGLVSSVGGNASVVSHEGNFMLVTPTHIDKVKLKPQEIVKVDLTDGHIIEGPSGSSETINHLSIYKSRKDIKAIIHAHPTISVGMITSGFIPKAPTSEYVMFVRNLVAVDFAPAGDESVRKLVEAFSQTDIVLLKNHGVFSVGSSIFDAFSRIEVLEEGAKIILIGKIFGKMPELSEDLAKETIEIYSKIMK